MRTAFPELEIESVIGAGGMGTVFKARQPNLDRSVALKVLSEGLARNPAFAERFNREARLLARLNHANIVTVHDFGRRGGYYYLLMEFVDGVNLRQAMHAGRFTAEQALALIPRICEALQFAHGEGVLHRDIKPENILLDGRGRVKIADFGIAKMLGDSAEKPSLTVSGAALGTPAYMAPEQLENPAGVDHRADIYSLGVVFYELLTGELPLGRFAPPSAKAPMDHRVDEIVLRALAKERELRQQSADQVRTEVEGVVNTPAPTTPPGVGMTPVHALPDAADFVLCHPRLPRMAQWITVYTIVVVPILWLMGLATLEAPRDSNPYVQFVSTLSTAVTVVGEMVVVGLLVAGGFKLRALMVSGPRWIRSGIWLHLGLIVVGITSAIWQLRLSRETELDVVRWSTGEMMVTVAGLSGLVFEVAALVWLSRHAHRLAAIFWKSAPNSKDAAEELALTAPAVGVAKHATLGAVLTLLSVGLGMAGAVGGALLAWVMTQGRQGAMGGVGIGAGELALGLAGAGVVGGAGLAGALLGWTGLREIKAAQVRRGGAGRCMLAAVGWPLVVMESCVLVGVGWASHRVGVGFWGMLLLGLVGALAVGELLVRIVCRWVGNVPRGKRSGRLPGWARGIIVASVVGVMASIVPVYMAGFAGSLRSQFQPMVATVRPSAEARVDDAVGRGVTFQAEYPPRATVWWAVESYRDGVLLAEPAAIVHVLNGELFESTTGPVRVRILEDGTSSWAVTFRVEGEVAEYVCPATLLKGVRWEVVNAAGEIRVGVGIPEELDVLRGTDEEGRVYRVRIQVRVEALPPTYLFEGTALGWGWDWGKTAADAVAREGNDGHE